MKTKIIPDRAIVIGRLSRAVADGKGITIRMDGDSGKLTIKVANEPIAVYSDIYEAVSVLLPAYAKELA